uniref:BURP domain-containing protein n=1 Tax=Cannabis sativa TaxID=3483 RepID=A0A803PCR9_CANSA
MASRYERGMLSFCLILMFMSCTSGVRNIQQGDQSYISGYAPRASEKREEVSDDVINNHDGYISGYGSKEIEKEKEVSNDFINNHQGYISGYGPGAREAEVSDDLVNNHQGYIAGYGPKTSEIEQKEHGDAVINQHYTRYHGKDKEKIEGPCTTTYKNIEETNDHLYITAYGKVEQKNELPYMTQYGNAKQTNEKPYITSYGKFEQKNELPYMTQYGNAKQMNEKPYIKHIHAVSSSNNVGDKHIGHGNDIQQSSIDSDRAKAFKQGFFTPDDLSAKKVMAVNFPIQEHSRFLPKEVADSIPFSLSQLPNLLQLFSIIDGSSQARDMEETIKDCRIKPIESEIKSCATSLESMVEFVHSILGSEVNFNLLSTTHPTMSTALTQNYTILEVPKEVLAPKVVVCHPVPYPYAIFLCHHFGTETKVFQASLGGKNGNNVEAVAICHMDTSHWDPTFILFQLLRVKPESLRLARSWYPKVSRLLSSLFYREMVEHMEEGEINEKQTIFREQLATLTAQMKENLERTQAVERENVSFKKENAALKVQPQSLTASMATLDNSQRRSKFQLIQ